MPADRIQRFRALHETGCFVMPNPWDAGSARYLRAQGFKALATTSLGFAFTQARADQDVPLDMMLAHIADLVAAVPDLPVNADFENAYADAPEDVAVNVKRCVATGVAGLSVEDATGRKTAPLYPRDLAVARIAAARRAIDETGSGVVLTARAECFLTGHKEPMTEALARLSAYAEAGADVLYAPGLRTLEDVRAVVAAAQGKPVNFLMYMDMGLSVAQLRDAGVRRISIGGALARAAWSGFMRATEEIVKSGTFGGFADVGRSAPLGVFFAEDLRGRGLDGR
ncbi:MAG: isocitrate lyase/PEP mutase family protein [Beijerinckiaceae bacterium]